MEGAARSIPSIALSQVYHGKVDWNNTKIFAPMVIAKVIKVGWPKDIVMSINFPATEKVNGVEFADQDEYNIYGDLTFTENLKCSLSFNWSREHSGSGSINKIKGGFIIITPKKLDFTDNDILNAMKNSCAEEFSSIANTPIASD